LFLWLGWSCTFFRNCSFFVELAFLFLFTARLVGQGFSPDCRKTIAGFIGCGKPHCFEKARLYRLRKNSWKLLQRAALYQGTTLVVP